MVTYLEPAGADGPWGKRPAFGLNETRVKEQEKRPQSRRHEEKLGPSSLEVMKQPDSYARASDRQAPTCAKAILRLVRMGIVVGSLHRSAGAHFSSMQLPDAHRNPITRMLLRTEARKIWVARILLCYYNCNNSFAGRWMVVELKVRKFGNSLGVVLPREVINRLQTGDGEPLFLIEAPEGGYRLTPYDPQFEKKMAKADDIISRYRNTLHVLAK